MNEKKYSDFVESMHRLHFDGMIQDSVLDKLLDDWLENHKITKDEYLYILTRKEV